MPFDHCASPGYWLVPSGGLKSLGIVRGSTRASLATYSPTYIRFVWTLSAGVLIMTYGLWAFGLRPAI